MILWLPSKFLLTGEAVVPLLTVWATKAPFWKGQGLVLPQHSPSPLQSSSPQLTACSSTTPQISHFPCAGTRWAGAPSLRLCCSAASLWPGCFSSRLEAAKKYCLSWTRQVTGSPDPCCDGLWASPCIICKRQRPGRGQLAQGYGSQSACKCEGPGLPALPSPGIELQRQSLPMACHQLGDFLQPPRSPHCTRSRIFKGPDMRRKGDCAEDLQVTRLSCLNIVKAERGQSGEKWAKS